VKDGFRSFNRDMTLRQDGTLRAILVEKANVPRSGKAFADQLSANQSAHQNI
jgi:hypothetical protein